MTQPSITRHVAAALLSLALGSGLAAAVEPATRYAAPQRADLIDVHGSIWLVTRHDGRTSFHTNPRVGDDAPAPLAEAPRDPLAPQTGIWYTTRHDGRTEFDVNPRIETGTERFGNELAVTDLRVTERLVAD